MYVSTYMYVYIHVHSYSTYKIAIHIPHTYRRIGLLSVHGYYVHTLH